MADIYCPKCGEACDLWEFDDPADRKLYQSQGCEAVGFGECSENTDKSLLISAVMDVMGDDLDGISSMMEDAEAMGLI